MGMSTCTRAQGFALAPTACAYEPPGETFTAKYFYLPDNYRPQRSWAKVMFLQASVILSTGGVSSREGEHPPGRETPRQETSPPKENPPARRPPLGGEPPRIRSMSGRYASYWNAFLLSIRIIRIYCTMNIYDNELIKFLNCYCLCGPFCFSIHVHVTICHIAIQRIKGLTYQ